MAKAKGLRAKKEEEKEVKVSTPKVDEAKDNKEETEEVKVSKSAANLEDEEVENAPKNDSKQDEEHAEEKDAKVDPEEKEADVDPSVQVAIAQPETKKAQSAKVRVKPNQDIKTYIGDSWYNLKKGKQENVPANVKTILQNAGMLEAL